MKVCRRLGFASSTIALALIVQGCGGGGGSRPSPTPTPTPTPSPTPTPTPSPSPTLNDAEYKASNSAVLANALAAYEAGATAAGVKVAVVDTGINPNLPEFTGRIDSQSQDVAANRGLTDTNGHGTMVSGVIAANRDGVYMQGVAFDATIVSLNVGDPAGCKAGNDCFLDSAIDDAIDLARTSGAKIINMSFGDEEGMTADVWPAIQSAIDEGLIIVMAAGNGGTANPNDFALQNIATNGDSGLFIIAGSMDSNRSLSSFSDRAGTTEAAQHYLVALGRGNATVNQFGTHVNVNGTSFATPTIVGAAALLAGTFPNLSGAEIVELLLSTADDAGAAGVDPIYGRGILNISRAFEPQGPTTIAGSSMSVSLFDNGTSSGPIGDASAQAGAGAVILDGYSRAYVLDLAKTLKRLPVDQPLRQAMSGHGYRSASAAAGPVSVTMSLRQNALGEQRIDLTEMQLSEEDHVRAREMALLAVSRITPDTAVALGISQTGRTLQQQLAETSENAFLVARDPMSRAGFHPRPFASISVRHSFGPVALSVTSERGKAVTTFERAHDTPGYTINSVTLDARQGAARFSLGASHLSEDETVLGSRFSPLLATGGARTTFVDAAAAVRLGRGWALHGSYRRGWTWARGSGGLVDNGHLASQAFAFDVSKQGLFAIDDTLAFRLMQPLRVTSGGFRLSAPVSYDYESRTALYGDRLLSLAPGGRELDFEFAYGLGLFGGRFDFNGFVRTEPGNVRSAKRDVGAAIRFTLSE